MADSAFMTPDSLIDALGGTSDVARALVVSPSVVSNWRARGKIPAEVWSEIAKLALARDVKGITLEALASMHARRPVEGDDEKIEAEARP